MRLGLLPAPGGGVHRGRGEDLLHPRPPVRGQVRAVQPLVCAARERKAQVALFGHTHHALEEYDDGLYLLNPGSLNSWEPSYGTVDITPQGIVTNVVKLRES